MSTILEEKNLIKEEIIEEFQKFVKSDKKEKEQLNFISYLKKKTLNEKFDYNFAIPSLNNMSLLELSSFYNCWTLMSYLMEMGANPNFTKSNLSSLNIACGRNNSGAIIQLLKYNADIFYEDATGKNPFSRICETGNFEMIELFLKKIKIDDLKKTNKKNQNIFEILREVAKTNGNEHINKVIAKIKEWSYLKEMTIKNSNVNRYKI